VEYEVELGRCVGKGEREEGLGGSVPRYDLRVYTCFGKVIDELGAHENALLNIDPKPGPTSFK